MYSDERVKIHQLTHMDIEGKPVYVIKELQMRWKVVGDLLKLKYPENEDCGCGREYDSCRRIFKTWVDGEGREPKTWEVVLLVLQAMDLTSTDLYHNLQLYLET